MNLNIATHSWTGRERHERTKPPLKSQEDLGELMYLEGAVDVRLTFTKTSNDGLYLLKQ